MNNDFSLEAQVEEVERELEMRKKVYPRMIVSHSLRQGQADYYVARMMAVHTTLKGLLAKRETAA